MNLTNRTILFLLAVAGLLMAAACATTPAAAAAGGTAVGVALPDALNLINQLHTSGALTDAQASHWTAYANTIGTGLQTVFGLIGDVSNALHATQTQVAAQTAALGAHIDSVASTAAANGQDMSTALKVAVPLAGMAVVDQAHRRKHVQSLQQAVASTQTGTSAKPA